MTDATKKCTGDFGPPEDYKIRPTFPGGDNWGSITFASNGLEAYADRADSDQPARIYRLTRKSESEEFGDAEMVLFGGEGDAGQRSEYSPAISPDGLSIYYMVDVASGKEGNSGDIWVSRRSSLDGRFGPGTDNPVLNDPDNRDVDPFVSHDGTTLYFSNGKNGSADIYAWQIGTFNSPVLLQSVSTPGNHERYPVLTDDGLTIYFSSNKEGFGKLDIYMRHRSNVNDGFGAELEPLDMVPTEALDSPEAVSRDGCTLWYSSSRLGLNTIRTRTRSRE